MLSDDLVGSMSDRPGMATEYQRFSCRSFGNMTVNLRRQASFSVSATAYRDGGYLLSRVITVGGRTQLVRTAGDVAGDGREDYGVVIPRIGSHDFVNRGQQIECRAGTAALVACFVPFTHTKPDDSYDSIYLAMPREFVEHRLIGAKRTFPRVHSIEHGLWLLARDTLCTLHREAVGLEKEQFTAAVRIAAELVLLALGGEADAQSGLSSIRAGALARAKHIIARGLSDSDLTLVAVAAESGISLRYLHSLFRTEPWSAHQYLKLQRLARARQLLNLADARSTTVTDIAIACGYSNLSQFSTAFRHEFGISPKDALHHREDGLAAARISSARPA
ncbi:MAG TPA: AraC family transcriptional regulator [Steroidobacteraceae bacterium]|jgi:AraC-like DNA-binding protein|nr:AraC family transcriptional regulator [Steroidobacteraceae bacterium]